MSAVSSAATREGLRAPPTALPAVAALLLALMWPLPAGGQECAPGSHCLTEAAIRRCDADQAELPELRVQLRIAEQRVAVARGDAESMWRAFESESATARQLRRELAAAQRWLPAWAWFGLGVVSALAVVVAVALLY